MAGWFFMPPSALVELHSGGDAMRWQLSRRLKQAKKTLRVGTGIIGVSFDCREQFALCRSLRAKSKNRNSPPVLTRHPRGT
jgi:hypothetical protein